MFGSVGGLFVATKFPVSHFSHTSFTNNTWQLNRGFATMELGVSGHVFARVIGTHHIHGDAVAARRVQVQQILSSVDKKTQAAAQKSLKNVATFYCGDLNMGLKELHTAAGDGVYPPENMGITCTDKFIQEAWDPKNTKPPERLDYVLQVKNGAPQATMTVTQKGLLNKVNSATALSDHDALVAQIALA